MPLNTRLVRAKSILERRVFLKALGLGMAAPLAFKLARTATGKLQKFKLRAPYWEGRDRQVQ